MSIQTLHDRYLSLLEKGKNEIEINGEVKLVRSYLLDAASTLLEIGKTVPRLKSDCDKKAFRLFEIAKVITKKEDFPSAYYQLTGSSLKQESGKPNSEVNIKKAPFTKEAACTKKAYEMTKQNKEFQFNWNLHPSVSFDDVAGLDEVKDTVKTNVILPLTHPELFEGYSKKNGGGIFLYGPPGTGKTMIAAAIAHEINAHFCSIGPSDLLTTGIGNSEKLIAKLFSEAKSFKCSVIFFDEFESLCPIQTQAQHARQIRSELLKQMQGLDSYEKDRNGILLLIGATNKPWSVDPAFIRPGRLGTRIYIDLPDDHAREYILTRALSQIEALNKVKIDPIDLKSVVERTSMFNGADMSNLIDKVQELSIKRALKNGVKTITQDDFDNAFQMVSSSVQKSDIDKLKEWKKENG